MDICIGFVADASWQMTPPTCYKCRVGLNERCFWTKCQRNGHDIQKLQRNTLQTNQELG